MCKNAKMLRRPRRDAAKPSRTQLEKAEALEKHGMTVIMRAETLATTEADFLKTLLERQEQTPRNVNELSSQL